MWGTCCKFCPQGDVWGVTTSKHRTPPINAQHQERGSHHHVATGPKVGSHHSTHQHNIRQGATSSRHSPEGGLPWRSLGVITPVCRSSRHHTGLQVIAPPSWRSARRKEPAEGSRTRTPTWIRSTMCHLTMLNGQASAQGLGGLQCAT